jgi:hypothetical protein
MKIFFYWKRFFLATILLFLVLLVLDAMYDGLMHELNLTKLFATENLIFKIIAAIIGGFFYAHLTRPNISEN